MRAYVDHPTPSMAPMGAAQDRLKGLLKNRWGPAFRELGFTGSGTTWTLPDERDWSMLGFQSSNASSASLVKFTMNLLVVGKDEWEWARAEHPWMRARPTPNVIPLTRRYWERSGTLTHGGDYWWELAADGSNEDQVADEVLAAVRDVLLPQLRREMRRGPAD